MGLVKMVMLEIKFKIYVLLVPQRFRTVLHARLILFLINMNVLLVLISIILILPKITVQIAKALLIIVFTVLRQKKTLQLIFPAINVSKVMKRMEMEYVLCLRNHNQILQS